VRCPSGHGQCAGHATLGNLAAMTPLTSWPPSHDGKVDSARLHWLQHPDLLATEVVVCREMATIIGVRRH
jgi:hypothetical protein